jgi:hypothetical protein
MGKQLLKKKRNGKEKDLARQGRGSAKETARNQVVKRTDQTTTINPGRNLSKTNLLISVQFIIWFKIYVRIEQVNLDRLVLIFKKNHKKIILIFLN